MTQYRPTTAISVIQVPYCLFVAYIHLQSCSRGIIARRGSSEWAPSVTTQIIIIIITGRIQGGISRGFPLSMITGSICLMFSKLLRVDLHVYRCFLPRTFISVTISTFNGKLSSHSTPSKCPGSTCFMMEALVICPKNENL